MRSAIPDSAGPPYAPDTLRSLGLLIATLRRVGRGRSDAAPLPHRRARTLASIAGAVALIAAGALVFGTIMRNQAVLEFDGAQTHQQQRIKSFVSEVRSAADTLRDDHADCSVGPSAARTACLRDAMRTSRVAIAAARSRYEVSREVDAHAQASREADAIATATKSIRPALAGHQSSSNPHWSQR